jgi:hypothetical protein
MAEQILRDNCSFLPVGRGEDLAGQKFGRLVVEGVAERRQYERGAKNFWQCLCECGGRAKVLGYKLKSGHTQSCGCIRKEVVAARNKAGITREVYRREGPTKLVAVWRTMKARCNNSPAYAGRGLSVCPEWQDFSAFRNWAMDNGYRGGLSLDRINNDEGYSPENCRWADLNTQARNRRNNRRITAFGETKTVVGWSEDPRCTVSYGALARRFGTLQEKYTDEQLIAVEDLGQLSRH